VGSIGDNYVLQNKLRKRNRRIHLGWE